MADRKKIAFVIGELTAGGAQRVISTLANSLINEFDITLITFTRHQPYYLLHEKIKVVACKHSIKPSKTIFNAIALNVGLLRSIIKILKAEKIDLAIGFITSANVLTAIAAKLLKIPCIISERNNPAYNAPEKFWRIMRRYAYPLATRLVVQTDGIKQYFQRRLKPEKIVILPNPISPELTRNRMIDAQKDNIILTVGRLHAQKDHQLLIKAFTNIHNQNWKLVIVGEGAKRENLQKLIDDLQMTESIFLAGNQTNIADYYNSAKIFVLTSKYEGFPNALIEAMHFGLPCISTDCPTGPAELIQHGKNGFLIPVGGQKSLENYLSELMRNELLRTEFSSNALSATQQFELPNAVIAWKKLVNDLLLPNKH